MLFFTIIIPTLLYSLTPTEVGSVGLFSLNTAGIMTTNFKLAL